MKWFAILAFMSGTMLPIQIGANVTLRSYLGHAMQAALISFAVGAMAILLYCSFARIALPKLSEIGQAPWWAWLGGLFGAFYIWMSIIVGPKIGAAMLLALVVAGQLVASLVIDHYALLNMPHNPVTPLRMLGMALVVIGVYVTVLSSK